MNDAQGITSVFILVALIALCGLYCILVSRNLIRILLGLEILTKAVTFLLALAGEISGERALAQSFIITLIVLEVVVIAVAAGVVISAYRQQGNLDVRGLHKLKG